MDYIYHIYNRSNETVFYSAENYFFFIEKIRKHIYPVCDILAWCLMPNHFHLLIQANDKSIELTNEKHRPALQQLSKNIGTTLSSYSQAINKARKRKGSLFAHSTEARQRNLQGNEYAKNCFFYIHQNPLQAGLVKKLEDWDYSSFPDYAGLRKGTLCNKDLAYEIINFNKENFYEQSYAIIEEKYLP
jgi:REP element-mobilizing transposase RayT